LLHHYRSRIYFINNSEETCDFCLMAGHNFKWYNKIFSLNLAKQRQFINIMPIPHFVHFQSILLKLECFKKLVNWQFSQLRCISLLLMRCNNIRLDARQLEIVALNFWFSLGTSLQIVWCIALTYSHFWLCVLGCFSTLTRAHISILHIILSLILLVF
jgi:hypothetical protein